ncbi:putative ficolin-1-like [Apostichopus japonicus]|uniref:Putative ficolin-1-like n=1 Tax=Stichopus japonicus TaxID=307972 RepID=A0A2G8LHC6_STIJA|nr:putative ficolin-1-like [Apostichopus japonicus]
MPIECFLEESCTLNVYYHTGNRQCRGKIFRYIILCFSTTSVSEGLQRSIEYLFLYPQYIWRFLIKPDGYPEPFEAYCDNDLDSGGWTVLQRRRSDSVNFNRNWKDFRNGFGFLGSEFWIGNEKIAFLTNQKRYQLRMNFENVAGDTYYVIYDKFRISDEWGKYYISSLGTFVKSDGIIPERCPANEIFSNEICERTCDDPDTCISATSRRETEQCVCVGDYLRQEDNASL